MGGQRTHRKTPSRRFWRTTGHFSLPFIQFLCVVSLCCYAWLRIEPVLPVTSTGILHAVTLTTGLSLLLVLPSLTLLCRHRISQLIYGGCLIAATAYWTQSIVPNDIPALQFCGTASVIGVLLQVAVLQMVARTGPVKRSWSVWTLVISLALVSASRLHPVSAHPGDRAWISIVPFIDTWLPAPKLDARDVKVLYPPSQSKLKAVIRPHIIFVFTDNLTVDQAESYVESLPTSCTVQRKHLASEDPVDGAFNLAFALDSFHRKPFHYSGQVPFAFHTLEYNGYARHSLAIRGLYDDHMLKEWGRLQLTSHKRLARLAEKRLGDRAQRPLALTIFPGDPALNHQLIERLADYARVDTVLFITGLSGPMGRTALISCAPIRWNANMTTHTQLLPSLFRMMGMDNPDWHTPFNAPPMLSSGDFPFTRSDATIFRNGKPQKVTLCAPEYVCFKPEDTELSARLTRFLQFP